MTHEATCFIRNHATVITAHRSGETIRARFTLTMVVPDMFTTGLFDENWELPQ